MFPTINIGDFFTFFGNLVREAFKIFVLKAILISAAILILPWCIEMGWRLILKIVSTVVEAVLSSDETLVKNPILVAGGALGFFFDCLRVSEIFANFISATIIAFTLRRIKP